jgi:ferredoxin-nitrite reductase
MTSLADLATAYGDGALYLTKEQNVELHHVAGDCIERVRDALESIGLRARAAGSVIDVQVCAGNEWCVWGVGDSRGLARSMSDELATLADFDASAEPLRVHISGCAHGCAQHAAADVGLSAVTMRDADNQPAEGYEVYAGGRLGKDPLTARRVGRVLGGEARTTATALLGRYLSERLPGESMSDFVDRIGRENLQPAGAGSRDDETAS